MTLLLAYISRTHAVLASDRRISWQIGGATKSFEDTQNKAVVLNGEFIMGFTGFARFGDDPTDEWVVKELASHAPSAWFGVLGKRTATEIVNIRGLQPHLRGHAYAAVGFPQGPPGAGTVPTLLELSNALDDNGYGWVPR